jgi:hypothetical protein
MDYLRLTQTLTESFSALADEVQSLTDRKTILEHKLRYAHEQVLTMSISIQSPGVFHALPRGIDKPFPIV